MTDFFPFLIVFIMYTKKENWFENDGKNNFRDFQQPKDITFYFKISTRDWGEILAYVSWFAEMCAWLLCFAPCFTSSFALKLHLNTLINFYKCQANAITARFVVFRIFFLCFMFCKPTDITRDLLVARFMVQFFTKILSI